jgi:hypothetical protein
VLGEYDLVVIGGGPAGIAAAASAARHGARTLLVERYGFLGGMGTAGGVTNFAGLYGRRGDGFVPVVHGVVDELLDRIAALGGLNAPQEGMKGRIRVRSYDVPAYKCAADALLQAAGAELLFHAWLADAVIEGPDAAPRIVAVVLQTKSGRVAVRARCFIDCSGDGDLAAQAGAPFELGDGAGSGLYPSTMFIVGNVDAERALGAVGSFEAIDARMQAVADRYRFARRGAILRPQRNPTQWRANVTQLAGPDGAALDALDARALSAGETEGRRQIVEYLRFLRAEVPGFEQAQLLDIAAQVGVRETRRVVAQTMLQGEDILASTRRDDRIGFNAWPMELHLAGRMEWAFPRDDSRAWCDLPWGMLRPQRVANLLVAGRCAGMSHEGQSAARASGACFVMGQAAGTAAAHWPNALGAVDLQRLQALLRVDGACLDDPE